MLVFFCANISNIVSKRKQDYYYVELFALISTLCQLLNTFLEE